MNIMVSICCITYNHEKYIAQALDSFLMQKTGFTYEILVHDDASTDSTADIIRDYAARYPALIKPVLQTENQHSRGIKVSTVFNVRRARGKYIAVCEGDDFWTDSGKLQKQVEYMEAHPECTLCCHAIDVVDRNQQSTKRAIKPYNRSRRVLIEDIIIGGGGFIGLNSVVYPKKCMDNPPAFYWQSPVGDVPLILFLASQGEVYYMNEIMSAYRIGVADSWTSRMAASREKMIQLRLGMMEVLNQFNDYTDYRYADSVAARQSENELLLLIAQGNMKAVRQDKYKSYRKQLGMYLYLMIYLNKHFPFLYNKLRVYKKHIISRIDVPDKRDKVY